MSLSIQQAKEKHQAALLALPGVVSIGIGLSNGEKVIIIGLDGKHPDSEEKIPTELDGYPLVKQTIGTIKTQ